MMKVETTKYYRMCVRPRQPLAEIGYYMVGISKLPGFEQPIKLSSNHIAFCDNRFTQHYASCDYGARIAS